MTGRERAPNAWPAAAALEARGETQLYQSVRDAWAPNSAVFTHFVEDLGDERTRRLLADRLVFRQTGAAAQHGLQSLGVHPTAFDAPSTTDRHPAS